MIELNNEIVNYEKIIYDIFNKKNIFSDKIKSNKKYTNNCIKELNEKNSIFKNNFICRLKRINDYFRDDDKTKSKLISKLREIGLKDGYKWSGIYSELIVLDYLILSSFDDISIEYEKIYDKNSCELSNSVIKKIDKNREKLDIDIKFTLYDNINIDADIKSFNSTYTELFENIFKIVKDKAINNKYNHNILLDHLYGDSYKYELETSDLENEIKNSNTENSLIDKLTNCVNSGKQYYEYKIRDGKILKFRISYKKYNIVDSGEFDYYKYAENYEYKVLSYYDKLSSCNNNFIIWVINPWFNKEIPLEDSFYEDRKKLYRSLARRIFINLNRNNEYMSKYYDKFVASDIKISDISKLISGIIFIEDFSIKNNINDLYKIYIYTNPNTTTKYYMENDIRRLLGYTNTSYNFKYDYDDFFYDNY